MASSRHVELLTSGDPSGLVRAQLVLRHRVGTSTASATSRTLACSAAVPVGQLVVVSGISNAASLSSVTDARGNTWVVLQVATPGSATVFLAYTFVTNALSNADNITMTFNAAHTRWAAELNEWSGAVALDTWKTNSAASTTSLTTGATAAIARRDELAVAVFGWDQAGSAQTPTASNFGWPGTAQTASTGAGDTAAIEEQTTASTQQFAAGGTVTATQTLVTGKAYAAIVATFLPAPVARSRRFFDNVGVTQALTPFAPGPHNPLLDDFNRTDEAPLVQGAEWAKVDAGTDDLRVLTNVAAHGAAGTATGRRYRAASAWASLTDQEAYFTVSTKAGNGDGYSALTRLHDLGTANWDGYELMALVAAGTDTVELRRVDNGAVTVLATYNQEHAAGDKFMLRSVGTSHEAWYFSPTVGWTRLGTVTDATYTSGPPGLGIKNTTARIDDYGGGPAAERARARRFIENAAIVDLLKIVQRNVTHRRRSGYRRTLGVASNSGTSLAVPVDYTPDKPGCVFVAVSWFAGGTNPTVSDSKGNSYTQDASFTTGARYTNLRVFRTDNAQGLVAGDTITVAQSPTGTDKSAIAFELDSVDGSVAPLQVSVAGGAGGAVSASITESEADEMLLVIGTSEATVLLDRAPEGMFQDVMNKVGSLQLLVSHRDEGIYESTQSPTARIGNANAGQPVIAVLGIRGKESLQRGAEATTYFDEVLADTAFWAYKLDEPSGTTANDSSGNGRNGTYEGSPTLGQPALVGDGGTSVKFTGSQHVRVGNFHMTDKQKLTIEAWARAASLGQSSKIVSKHSSTSDVEGTIGVSGGVWTFELTTGGTYHLLNSVTRLDDKRHQIVATYDGATMRLYIDRILDASVAATGDIAQSAQKWNIASLQDGVGNFFVGDIDAVSTHNSVLTQARINARFDAGLRFNPRNTEAVAETSDLSQLDVVSTTEPPPPTAEDTLAIAPTSVFSMDEATAETTDLTQTFDQAGSVADTGNTYDVSQTSDPTITAEAIKEFVRVIQTMQLTMDTLGDESENIFLEHTNVLTNDDFVVGSVLEIRRLVQELVFSIVDSIRSDIDLLTIEQTNILSIMEAFDELLISQTMTFSMDEFIPQTVEALTLLMQNVVSISEDAEVVRVISTNLLTLAENTELSNIVQTNVPQIDEILVVPGSGFNENLTLTQTNVLSILDQVLVFGYDELKITQTNVLRISERILSPPVPPPDTSDGVEFSRVTLPYAPVTLSLGAGVAAGTTSWTLSGPTASLPAGGFVLEIGDELVYVTARFGSTVIVVRGWSLTDPAAHSAGATVTWPTHYDMALASPVAGSPGDWITVFDATQAYLDGQRYAYHVEQVLSVGKTTAAAPNKLDGPQPWRASPVVGVTESVPGGVCQPARLIIQMNVGDRIVVRYNNTVAPTGVFQLGPRAVFFMLWGGNLQQSPIGPVTVPEGDLLSMAGLFTDTDPQAGGINLTYYAQKGYRWISYQGINDGIADNTPNLATARAAGFTNVGIWCVAYGGEADSVVSKRATLQRVGQASGEKAVAVGADHLIMDLEFIFKFTGGTGLGQDTIDAIRAGGFTGPVYLSTFGSPGVGNDFNMDVTPFAGVLPQAYSNETPNYDPALCKTYWTTVNGGGARTLPASKVNYTIGLYTGALGRFTGAQEVVLLNAAGVNRNFSIFLAETALLADVTALEYFTGGAATSDPTGTSGATNNAFLRFDDAGNLDMSNPNANIYDGKSTINMTYPNSAGLIRATEFGADRYWTIPVGEGGKGKSGVNLGVLVLRNSFSDVPFWTSPDWRDGEWAFMGFDDPDGMFVQAVYKYHITPASDDVYGPNATWTDPGYETSTAFAMFLVPTPFVPQRTGHPYPSPEDPGGGGGGGGIFKPPPAPPPDVPGHQVVLLKKVKK